MRLCYSLLGVGLLLTAVVGCNTLNPPENPAARVRVVHASPDAPAVDICAGSTAIFQDVSYPSATEYVTVPAATYNAAAVVAGAGCDSTAALETALPLEAGTDTTVVALNLLADLEALVLVDDYSTPAAGNAKVRFVHASPDAPTVDITLADGTTVFDDVSFKGVGDYVELAAGDYDLQVRDAGGETVVLELGTVTLETGRIYTAYAVGLVGGEPALDHLITLDN